MRPIQIEAWTLDIIDRVNSNKPIEDYRVELKSEWPEPQKAARQLAGHSNAARGEPILWLIGIDEDNGVIGASHQELSNWFAAVQSEFDGVVPSMIDLNVPVNGAVIVALYFETNRAPYVIRNPLFGSERGGAISYETPWREGTSTRSARRADLIKILVPTISLPEIDILEGRLNLSEDRDGNWNWHLNLSTYITPQIGFPCVLPFHQSEASFEIVNLIEKTAFDNVRLTPPYNRHRSGSGSPFATEPDSLTIGHTQNEAIIEGPGRLNIIGSKQLQSRNCDIQESRINLIVRIKPSHSDFAKEINETLFWHTPGEGYLGSWVLNMAT